MTDPTTPPTPPLHDVELSLPWMATGRLGEAETRTVDAALSRDPELRRRLGLAEEERIASVALNESLGAPSLRVREDLFARIAAAEARSPSGFLQRVLDLFAGLSPRATALAAGLAALVILVQAGFIARTVLAPGSTYQTASQPGAAGQEGAFVLLAFRPEASAAQIAEILQGRQATITDGPFPGGLFRVRVAAKPLTGTELSDAMTALRSRSDIVRIVLPAPGR